MNPAIHDHELDALPQARGYYPGPVLPNAMPGFYRSPMGKTLVHVEKRGPAFDAAAAVARLLSALTRGVFIDVMSAWTDLLAAVNVSPSPLSAGEVFWTDMVSATKAALLSGSSPDAVLLWAKADEAVRGYALVAATRHDADAKRTQGDDHWDDVEDSRKADILHTHGQAALLRAFAKAAA